MKRNIIEKNKNDPVFLTINLMKFSTKSRLELKKKLWYILILRIRFQKILRP
jgi:hypothetical protein